MNLDSLTPKQLARYEDSLDVLRMVKSGTSFYKASKTVGISPSTAKKILGPSITKKNNRIIAKKTDTLTRKLRIYENGKEVFIQVNGSKNAKKIAQYHSAVGRVIDKGDKSALEPFKQTLVKDSSGKYHKFETDITKITQIFARREEPEFFTIYKR